MQTKEAQWRERFNKLQSSGLTVVDFCQQENIGISTYYSWRTRLGLDIKPQPNHSSSRFVQVKTINTTEIIAQPNVQINIQIGQVSIELSETTQSSWVAQLVREVNA